MLDIHTRKLVNPLINKLADQLIRVPWMHANLLTLSGFIAGLCAMLAIMFECYMVGVAFILINRLFDGLDGAIARRQALSDLGGYLDIVCDFIIYAGIPFSFTIARPENAQALAFLIFSYIGATSSFLAYAILAAKRGKTSEHHGPKTFYYLGGICEGTETFLVMLLMCFFPYLIDFIAFGYGLLCWLTCLGRSMQVVKDFPKAT